MQRSRKTSGTQANVVHENNNIIKVFQTNNKKTLIIYWKQQLLEEPTG